MLNRYIPRLWKRVFYNLYPICQPDGSSVRTLCKESVVETFTISEAIPFGIEGDAGNNDELKLRDGENGACIVRFQHTVAVTDQLGF